MAADTDHAASAGRKGGKKTVERYDRTTRWFHAVVYVLVLVLLGTGWWLVAGQEGDPSPLAALTGLPDTDLHKIAGWALGVVAVAGLVIGRRGVATFLRASVRFRRTDLGWFARWPRAVFTGRFGHHDGHFDPGQRVLNIALLVTLGTLVVSGAWLVLLHGGPVFAVLHRVHTWATYLATPLIAGHVLVASGILPGYRGVWRSMHLGGRLDKGVARRLWPEWSRWDARCPPAALLGGHLLGSVDEEERAELRRHLDGCARCRAELAGLRDVARHLE
ncbi:cytochrome b/b6 domain-containing protein [Acrocarpospora sp. B8E8]|uniref:cytochrome b/b6 domain-containing protein n=1 Tax=Acrocarpospora sp. B8E8 TaxID=3153572 RepID=UPI00325D4310